MVLAIVAGVVVVLFEGVESGTTTGCGPEWASQPLVVLACVGLGAVGSTL